MDVRLEEGKGRGRGRGRGRLVRGRGLLCTYVSDLMGVEGGDLKSMYIGGCLMCVWDRVLFVIQGTVAFTTGGKKG